MKGIHWSVESKSHEFEVLSETPFTANPEREN